MEQYSKFAPTGVDPKGLGLEDRQDWYVAPCSITRDSGLRDESNFKTLVKILEEADPEGEDYEIHRFGHWGPGWFEIILVRPDTKCYEEAESCECALADYPLLNDSDYSERQYDATVKNIESNGPDFGDHEEPEDWANQVFSWLWDNKQSAIEDHDEHGGYPSEEDICDALDALGIEYEKDD